MRTSSVRDEAEAEAKGQNFMLSSFISTLLFISCNGIFVLLLLFCFFPLKKKKPLRWKNVSCCQTLVFVIYGVYCLLDYDFDSVIISIDWDDMIMMICDYFDCIKADRAANADLMYFLHITLDSDVKS